MPAGAVAWIGWQSAPGRGHMPVRVFKPPLRERAPVYRRVRAADLPAAMGSTASREHVPLVSLVKDWEDFPGEREAMIADAPQGEDLADLCRIAAVVHALCERDGATIPSWVWEHRSEVPIAWGKSVPMTGFIWDQTIANAPPACKHHNVWFDYQFISSVRRRVIKDNFRDFAP